MNGKTSDLGLEFGSFFRFLEHCRTVEEETAKKTFTMASTNQDKKPLGLLFFN